jgi:hypothetical protein
MTTFKDVFSYESLEYYTDFPDRDSDTYVNCMMLKNVGFLSKGQFVPFICVSLEFSADDQIEYLYDREFVKPFPFIYRTSYEPSDVANEDNRRRANRASECQRTVYYDCEMLQNVGSFQLGEEYPYITVTTSLFAFDEEGKIMLKS